MWLLALTPALADYIDAVKTGRLYQLVSEAGFPNTEAVPVFYAGEYPEPLTEAAWMDRLRKEAESRRVEPVNAKVDRVWKAIPGLNGLEVDLEKTVHLARSIGAYDLIPFVYREIPPAIDLDDLGPQPIYKGNPNKPMISIMINVAWGDEYIPGILNTLEEEGVKATFFFDGSWLANHLDLARQIGEKGHELSNHAYSHKNMSRLSRAEMIEEISKTQQLLAEKLGVDNRLFAPPSGDYNEETVRVAHELGLKTILWTFDTIDWKNPEPDVIIRRFAGLVEPGTLVLMHPTEASSKALPEMIRIARQKGLTLGTVSELLSPKRVPELATRINQ